MTGIKRLLPWGSGEWISVLLACGHRRRVRRAEAKAEQLMIGKMVRCAECEAEVSKGKFGVIPGGRAS
jgi:hypothetical protein